MLIETQNTQAVLMHFVKTTRENHLKMDEVVTALKRQFIIDVLTDCNFNQCRAAKELGRHRNTLNRDMAHLGIDPQAIRQLKAKHRAQVRVIIGV